MGVVRCKDAWGLVVKERLAEEQEHAKEDAKNVK
jgi:hypothetical protein